MSRPFKDYGPLAIRRGACSFSDIDIKYLIEQCKFIDDSDLCQDYPNLTIQEAVKESLERDLFMYMVNVDSSLMPHMHMPYKTRIKRISSINNKPSLIKLYPNRWTAEELHKDLTVDSVKKRKKRPILAYLLYDLYQTYIKGTGRIDDKGYHQDGFIILAEFVIEKIKPDKKESKGGTINDSIRDMRKIFLDN